MEPIKIPKQSTTKIPNTPSIDYDRLLDMSNQTLSMDMAPPVEQSQLDNAAGYRDLGSLAAALSGAVRGAGSVGGKLPDDFGFPQIARDLGNSRTMDLQNRMALRKQQENDMLEAIKNSGIAQQAKLAAERRAKPISEMDRKIASARLKQFDPNLPDLPSEMTYGDLENEPFLSQILGIDSGTSGMSEYQKASLEIQRLRAEQDAALRDRMLAIQGGKASTDVDESSAKEAERTAENERKAQLISDTELEALHAGLKRAGVTKLPKSVTRGEVEKSQLYTSILKGAAPTANQDATQGRLKTQAESKTTKSNEVKQKVLDEINGIDNVITTIEKIRPLKSKVTTGPFDARAGKIGNFIKEGTNEMFGTKMKLNEDRVKLEQEVGLNLADYVLAISGKASSDRERQFLKNNMPTLEDTDQRFMIKLDNLEKYMRDKRSNLEKQQGFYGRQVPPASNGSSSGVPKDALDKSTDAYNEFMQDAIPYTPNPNAQPKRKVFQP